MKRLDNPELKTRILTHLADQYKIMEVREPNHLSTFIYCRTRTFLDQKQATEPTEQEVMLFALGYGLQDVLTPKDAEAPIIENNGIIYSPDMILSARQNEIKTTRKSAKHHFTDDAMPETWLAYMKGGCYMMRTNEYDLIVLYMMGNYSPPFPLIYADTFVFEPEELANNWQMILRNKAVLDESLSSGIPPTPYAHCYEWECKYCRNVLVCQSIAGASSRQLEEDKKLWN